MPSLSDLPVELLLDNLLPVTSVRDILSLAKTSKFFAAICADDTFWKHKCAEEFNFSGTETARTTGWKILYKGLSHPRLFVWGESRNGRLAIDFDKAPYGMPYPMELKMPNKRLVSLVAGGMSFHALDSEGEMYVWGTLNGEIGALASDGFSEAGKMASVPCKLDLPERMRSISCGRLHTMTLDAKLQVWTFINWGRPFRLESPLLDCQTPDTTPIQVESGWAFSSVLTKTGDVLVFWPYKDEMKAAIDACYAEMDSRGNLRAQATNDHIIRCAPWTLRQDPFRLPVIPQLPDLPHTGLSKEQLQKETKLIKIAAYDCHIIGLTNKGHVLKYGQLSGASEYTQSRWEYLPQFSEAGLVSQQPAFSDEGSQLQAPKTMLITHISAHFLTFVAYSTGASSIILMGDTNTNATSAPKIIPALQHRSIISVVLGDYHFGALTSTGELLTWGNWSKGALGLGDPRNLPVGSPGGFANEQHRRDAALHRTYREPPRVENPTEVNFNYSRHGKGGRKFCFAATAAGWHMGALVIDLEPEKEAEAEDELPMPGQFPSGSSRGTEEHLEPAPGTMPRLPISEHFNLFRFGFPARGRGGFRG